MYIDPDVHAFVYNFSENVFLNICGDSLISMN